MPDPFWTALDPSQRSGLVMTLGEAGARLGVSRAELEAMIEAGTVEALSTGFARMVPTNDVVRLAERPSGRTGN